MDDYNWLQHGHRSFNRKIVEEGLEQTILTLPLEDQQTILLIWLGIFLKVGDSCPNLQRAFEVWWRMTFVKPYNEQPRVHRNRDGADITLLLKMECDVSYKAPSNHHFACIGFSESLCN
ncbi:hypothetical protein GUJ93_ZPchr0013g36448 [Zizania palustris]|uniref:At3g05675-like ankyrin-like domain-containing protein n=1 Tax=Zizania palustris TaxID=103762 RepID=A0A8J6BZ64_ZIZPA|nr:hypothetical protein GUJ93_ZPchr0013g36448 [Zizania palustris]